MSEKQKQAQQARRERERSENHAANQAAKAAEVAASRVPDGPVEFQPDPNATQDAFARNREDGEQKSFKRGNPVRSAAYDEITASRRQQHEENQRQQQESHIHEDVRMTQEKPAPEPVQAAPAPAPAPVQTPEPEPEPQPEMVRVKVDGEEFSVLKSEVDEFGGVKQYQMFKAQEKRLQEARQLAADMNRMFQQSQQKPPEPVKKPEEELREIVTKIQLGTPEEGAQALQQALQGLAPKPVDPQAVAYQAYMLSQVKAAEDSFVANNKDLVSNPMLLNLVVSEKNRRIAELQAQKRLPEDWNGFYNQIALDIRTAIGRPTTATQPVQQPSQPTSGVAEKEARKASITALPTAAARVAQPEAEKPLTRDDILARARQARGQPV